MGYLKTIQTMTLCLTALLIIVTTLPAQAKRYKELTRDNVEDFIRLASDMTTGKTGDDTKTITRYFKKHLTKDARFKSTMKFVLPGFPPKESALALDKDDFIQNVIDGKKAFEDHQSEITITNIKIVSNGRQALVQTEGRETGLVAVPIGDTGTVERVPIEGFTQCKQIIRLSKKGVIQMYNAVCDTLIEFTGGL